MTQTIRSGNRRRLGTATRLVAVLTLLLIVVSVGSAHPQSVSDADWERLLGAVPGTRVTVTLIEGAELRGSLVTASADSVKLNDNELRRGQVVLGDGESLRGVVTIARAKVASVSLAGGQANPEYRFSGSAGPDADAVKRVANALGVGAKVDMATATGSVRGHIREISDGHLTVAHGRPETPVRVPFDAVTSLRRARMRFIAKLAIATGVYVGISMAYLLAFALSVDG
jgi:hypothetical protein